MFVKAVCLTFFKTLTFLSGGKTTAILKEVSFKGGRVDIKRTGIPREETVGRLLPSPDDWGSAVGGEIFVTFAKVPATEESAVGG